MLITAITVIFRTSNFFANYYQLWENLARYPYFVKKNCAIFNRVEGCWYKIDMVWGKTSGLFLKSPIIFSSENEKIGQNSYKDEDISRKDQCCCSPLYLKRRTKMFVRNHPFFKLIHGCNITIISQKDWVNPLLFSEIKEQAKEVY